MFIVGWPLSVDIPEHALERAEERAGLSSRQVLEYWQRIIDSGLDWLSMIPITGSHRLIDGGVVWIVKRYSDSAVRVMTVFREGSKTR